MNKYDLINSIITQVDMLVDMHGAEKCRTVLEIISKLAALADGLKKDETAAQERINELQSQLDELNGPADDYEVIGGKRYKIGEVAKKE